MAFNIDEAIDDLYVKLSFVERLDESDLADQLGAIGFECMGCGECCRGHWGDNRIIVFPDEIMGIINGHNLHWNEICKPTEPRFIDSHEILHAFEWELNRNNNEDCIFLNEKTCSIYLQRPWICRTYPFFLAFEDVSSHPLLKISDCRGIGTSLKKKDAVRMAHLLKMRLAGEIYEEIQMLKNLVEYDDWKLIEGFSNSRINGKITITIHDSRGKTNVLY